MIQSSHVTYDLIRTNFVKYIVAIYRFTATMCRRYIDNNKHQCAVYQRSKVNLSFSFVIPLFKHISLYSY